MSPRSIFCLVLVMAVRFVNANRWYREYDAHAHAHAHMPGTMLRSRFQSVIWHHRTVSVDLVDSVDRKEALVHLARGVHRVDLAGARTHSEVDSTTRTTEPLCRMHVLFSFWECVFSSPNSVGTLRGSYGKGKEGVLRSLRRAAVNV